MAGHKGGGGGCRKKTQVSLVIRAEDEPRHRAGVSSLQLDPHTDRLYTAGRDSIVRVWHDRLDGAPQYLHSMEHHTDWVNDAVLCCQGKNLISASSDTTVKVWNAHKGFCMSTLRTHKDYVRALAYAQHKEQVASAGLDKAIFLWDVNTLTALTATNNTVTTSSLNGNTESIYSLAMNPAGTVLVSGSTEKVLRVWDPHSCVKLMTLKGHGDNVKALVVSADGQQCASGSSDGTIKHWSLAQQRCVQTVRVHQQAVWALLASDTFTHVVSGGRDRRVVMTELRDPDNTALVCEEAAPVLKLCFSADRRSVWVATSDSSVRRWKLPPPGSDLCSFTPEAPLAEIAGGAAVRHYAVLNDKRHVLTKDTDGNVALYDVLKAVKVDDLGKVDFDEEIKRRFKPVHVPNWFNVDLKTGMLTVHLGQDEVDCLGAWVSAKDAGLTSDRDQKVNYGSLLLQALLEKWPHPQRAPVDPEGGSKTSGNSYFSVPPHTPLIFSEVGGRTLFRLAVGDAGGDTERALLNDTVPSWVVDVAIEMNAPKLVKLPFYLLPYSNCQSKQDRQKRDRLIANDFIQCRKVAEHVLEKILGGIDGSGGSSGSNSTAQNQNQNSQPPLAKAAAATNGDSPGEAPEDKIQLLCCDQVLDPNMDLRTVRHFICKPNVEFTLHYRTLK